jgi:hypothetical protein
MKKLNVILSGFVAVLLCSCAEEEYGYYDRPGYSEADVDFYYVSGRPYSRSYGPLYHRSGRYYYSRGGTYVIYDRPTVVLRRDVIWRDRRDRYRDADRDDDRDNDRDDDRWGRRYSSETRSRADSDVDRRDTVRRQRSVTASKPVRREVKTEEVEEQAPQKKKKVSKKKSRQDEAASETVPVPTGL